MEYSFDFNGKAYGKYTLVKFRDRNGVVREGKVMGFISGSSYKDAQISLLYFTDAELTKAKADLMGLKEFEKLALIEVLGVGAAPASSEEMKEKSIPSHNSNKQSGKTAASTPVRDKATSANESNDNSSRNLTGFGIWFLLSEIAALIFGIAGSIYIEYSFWEGFLATTAFVVLMFFINLFIFHKIDPDQQKESHKRNHNNYAYKCPMCGSHLVKSIGVGKKTVSIGIFGAASSDFGKNYQCDNCNYKW